MIQLSMPLFGVIMIVSFAMGYFLCKLMNTSKNNIKEWHIVWKHLVTKEIHIQIFEGKTEKEARELFDYWLEPREHDVVEVLSCSEIKR